MKHNFPPANPPHTTYLWLGSCSEHHNSTGLSLRQVPCRWTYTASLHLKNVHQQAIHHKGDRHHTGWCCRPCWLFGIPSGCVRDFVPQGVPMLALLRCCAWGMFVVIAARFYVENVWRLCCTLSCVKYRFIIRFIVALPVEPWLLCAAMWKNVSAICCISLRTGERFVLTELGCPPKILFLLHECVWWLQIPTSKTGYISSRAGSIYQRCKGI